MAKRSGKYRIYRAPVVQPLDQSIRLISLTKGQVTTVDAAKYEWLMQWNWIAHWNVCTKSFYACRSNGGQAMHRMLLGLKRGEFGDHSNHDTLDNRLSNIRRCTRNQNMQNRRLFSNNTSKITGVSYHARDKCWQAYINTDGRRTYLGYFGTKEEAAKARLAATVEQHEKFRYIHH